MVVFYQIMALFVLMAFGFALAKAKIIDRTTVKGLSTLVIKATLPVLIIMSMQKPFSHELLSLAFKTLGLASIFYAGVIVLSLGLSKVFKVSKEKQGVIAFALSFSNCAFIGFPVVASILGEDALFIISIHNILFNVLAFSVGIIMVAKKDAQTKKRVSVKQLFNVNVVAALFGFFLFIFSISIPELIANPLRMFGNLTTPLAMVVTGALLANTPIRAVLGNWLLYVISVLRLGVWPALTAFILMLCGIKGDLFAISVIVAGMPVASNTGMIAEVYGGDTDLASSLIFMTTFFSVISIPLIALFL